MREFVITVRCGYCFRLFCDSILLSLGVIRFYKGKDFICILCKYDIVNLEEVIDGQYIEIQF